MTTTLQKEESRQKEIPIEDNKQKVEAKPKRTLTNAKETIELYHIWVPEKTVQAQHKFGYQRKQSERHTIQNQGFKRQKEIKDAKKL